MFDRKEITINKSIKGEDNIFTLLNGELERLYKFLNSQSRNASKENTPIIWTKITEFQKVTMLLAEKGATEDVQKAIRDLQSSMGDMLLTGNGSESNKAK